MSSRLSGAVRNILLPVSATRFVRAVFTVGNSLFVTRQTACRSYGEVSGDTYHAKPQKNIGRRVGGSHFVKQAVLLIGLLLGAVSQAQAGVFCSTINGGNIDGDIPAVRAELATLTQITIDSDCTFSNFPQSNPLTVTVNFQTNDPSIYLIVFDNVYFSGNMACSNVDHKLWFVNGADYASGNSCQDLFIPVESIGKQSPAATAAIGEPFTYTLKIPVMYDPAGDIWHDTPSPNTIGNIKICDDLTDLIGPDYYEPADKATGADLTYISHTATLDGAPITLNHSPADPTFCPAADGNKILYFSDVNNAALTNLPAGSQIELDITVVLDNTPANTVGSTFINNAEWWFARSIDLDENGIIEQATGPYDEITGTCFTGIDADGDGKCEYEFFEPLPGQSGAAARMAIDEPDLQVTKSADQTAINIGDPINYTVEVYNAGTVAAWDTEITDILPTGMCNTTDPTLTHTAQITDSGATVRTLTEGVGDDYTVSYDSATCTLLLTMESANAAIGPAETLSFTYLSTLDANFDTVGTSGDTLTNYAGTTDWYTADPEGSYTPVSGGSAITNGTPGVPDDEDSYTVTAQLSGYIFTKTVVNTTTGDGPGLNISALPGDTLRYQLRLFNVDQNIDNITLTDVLDPAYFDENSLVIDTAALPLPAGAIYSYDSTTGTLIITGDGITPLSVSQGNEVTIEFEIDVDPLLGDTIIYNQASLIADAGFTATSDDPYVNGPASPDIIGDEDETPVYVQSANDLTKANPLDTTVTIGEEFTYTVTVTAPSSMALYDVVIHDDVSGSAADMEIVGVNDPSGQWLLSHDGTNIWDTVTGIDIPAGGSVTIEITMRLQNTDTNVDGLPFYNSAYYSYRRTNDTAAPQLTTNTVSTPADMTVVESDLTTSTKSATYVSPATKTVGTDAATAGDVLQYTLTIPNTGNSTAYDVTVVDILPADVSFNTGSATASLYDPSGPTTTPVAGFVVDPDPGLLATGTAVWGADNTDDSLDIPLGQELIITYEVTVASVTGSDITNEVHIDWSSLDAASIYERDGAGCPTVAAPDTYCYSPTPVTIATQDNTSLAKLVSDDSYAESPASASNPVVRVGDTVTYDLVLNLQEYTTQNVVVTDQLPAGMELVSFSYDHGTTTFNYTIVSEPTAPATGPLTWEFGDIENVPSGDATPVDPLTIRYVARVLHGAGETPDPTPTTQTLPNGAVLTYTGYDVANPALSANAPVDVLQPQITTITKSGTVVGGAAGGDGLSAATAFEVDIVNNSMDFQLQACNDGNAPAYGVQLIDDLPLELDESGLTTTPPVVTVGASTLTAGSDYILTVPARDGQMVVTLDATVPVAPTECVTVNYSLGFYTDIAPDTTWSNSGTVTEYWSRPTLAPADAREYIAITPVTASSIWMTNGFTDEPPAKSVVTPASGEVTIGQDVTYEITVPATPVNAALSNVTIIDTLDSRLAYQSFTPVSGPAVTYNNDAPAMTFDVAQIPAGQQVVLQVTARLINDGTTNAPDTIDNSVAYTHADQATPIVATVPATVTIVEPALGMTKAVNNVTAGKLATDPAAGGDTLEYTLTVTTNGGTSTASDINVTDILPAELSYVAGSATWSIDAGAPAALSAPATPAADTYVWGRDSGDNLDLPVGSTLVVTYRTTVDEIAGASIDNSAWVDWTSLDGVPAEVNRERTGDGCGLAGIVAPNDYCFGAVTTPILTLDNTAIAKAISGDTWSTDGSTGVDAIARAGDTVTYQLSLTLNEGLSRNVSVTDVLDPGLAFVDVVSINGDTVAPYGSAGVFSYTDIPATSVPAAGATGTLSWSLGDITNLIDNDTTNNTLVIAYRARVQHGLAEAPTHTPTTALGNSVTLGYEYADGTPLTTTPAVASLEVRQPQITTITKSATVVGPAAAGDGLSATTAYAVDILANSMDFQLQACNDGNAPAYGVQLIDDLPLELDESGLTTTPPVVTVGASTLTAGSDYILTVPARDGQMVVTLDATVPVAPTECVTVNYSLGFYTDIAPDTTWSNSGTVTEYWSRPTLAPADAREYIAITPVTASSIWMTNFFAITPLSKSVVSPASEITVGELVTYQIVVPATPVNAALDSVVVSDTLHDALLYQNDASAVFNSGAAVALTPTVSGQDTSWDISQIPAGEQVTITFTARVDNNSFANAGVSFDNTAAYTYTGMSDTTLTQATSGALTIIEPELAIGKTVTNTTNPGLSPVVGDILQYSVTFTASGGGAGDNFSDAFDLLIDDSLSLGLLYVTGSATVDGSGNTIADPATNGGDGVATAQVLTWSLAGATADIDVVEGSTVTVTYDVGVLPGAQAGQDLTNSASVQWTGIDDPNAFERNGTATLAENDYFSGPATTTLTTQLAVTFTKSVINTTTSQDPGANASPDDTLQYTLVITNQSVATLTNGVVVDELAAEFAPGTLSVSVSGGLAYTDNSSSTGGVNGTGIVDINGISLAPQGSADDTLTIVVEATLASVIQSGTNVLNQAQLTADALPATNSNQTSTLIDSAPLFDVWKSSQDLNGGTLIPGDTLRYSITVQNIGTESAVNTTLRDLVPGNTSYVAGSTSLNGTAVSDVSGTTALQDGMLINAPEDTTPGAMRADASGTTTNVATITFDVIVNDVFDGTVISNQGYVAADGAGTSGSVPEEPSDDPSTATLNDPTLDVVGNVPSVDAQKLVAISVDGGLPGVADAGDQLLYTITVTNNGTTPATNVVLTDAVPVNTAYVPGTVTLNGNPVADVAGVSPLVAGTPINSADTVTPGTISPGQTATVTFEVTINAVAAGIVISNQGTVSLDQQVDEPTDFDGIDSNGDQPTTIVVGAAQQLAITKEAFIVGGGAALPGTTVEYLVRVTNTSTAPATNVVITDNLDLPVAGQLVYVTGSATMNGSNNGVDDSALPLLTANYAATYGDLLPGGVVTLRFRAQLNAALIDGTEVLNTADVQWDSPLQTASATARLVVGGYYGVATLKGKLWHDANFNNVYDSAELPQASWNVDLYRNGTFVGTTLSDTTGNYTLTNIQPNDISGDLLEVRFRAPGAGANTAAMGRTDSPFTDGLQNISAITVAIGDSIPNLNLPIDPSGVVYESISRTPVAGAALTMLGGAGGALPANCFDDPVQQGQVTLASGYYKFDLNFSDAACLQGGDYVISVTPPASGFDSVPSRIIPPATDAASAAYSVPLCSGDAVASPAGYCEAQSSEFAPSTAVPARTAGTTYYLHLTLDDPQPGSSQLFNNHIPLDPELAEAVAISKRSARVNVSRGELVPYTITVNNSYLSALSGLTIIDTFPAGFKYVEGSSRYDGIRLDPTITGNQLRWENIDLGSGVQHTIQMLFVVSSGVSEGEYVNRAQVIEPFTLNAVSGEATATVRVVPDPTFDCTDIIGKVFDDKNLNGVQDEGEAGLPGARVVTARGLIVTADEHGRFHITCAAVPNESRGSNFILKLDDRSLPSGYRVTSENPRVLRATRGKMLKFNFGATIHHVVRLDVADSVFDKGSTSMRKQWQSRVAMLLNELKKAPSVLRLSYLADVEDEGLVDDRMADLRDMIATQWDALNCCYKLTIESEVYWRRGAPPKRSGVLD